MTKLRFLWIAGEFAVCRMAANAPILAWAAAAGFVSITRTDEELSIVCLAQDVPADVRAEHGWTCFKLEGPFAFGETGILSSFIGPLADNRIPVFAISTFDTDYVLLKKEFVGHALSVLASAGHEFVGPAVE